MQSLELGVEVEWAVCIKGLVKCHFERSREIFRESEVESCVFRVTSCEWADGSPKSEVESCEFRVSSRQWFSMQWAIEQFKND